MVQGCCGGLAKCVLILFNTCFWLSGVAMLAVGIWVRADDSINKHLEILEEIDDQNFMHTVSYMMMAAGGAVFIVGFWGCCAAIKENRCMLGTYIFLLVVVLGIELAAGVCAAVFKDDIIDTVREEWVDMLRKEYRLTNNENDKKTGFALAMDFLQVRFGCCGVTNGLSYDAYNGSEFQKNDENILIPESCCKMNEGKRPDNTDGVIEFLKLDGEQATQHYVSLTDCQTNHKSEYRNDKGCYDQLEDYINDKAIILIAVGIAIACIQLFGIVATVCVCRNRDDDEK